MDRFHEGLIDVLTRCRNVNKGNRESKAASLTATRINKTKLIHDFINGKN
jgi:hypothetical protein